MMILLPKTLVQIYMPHSSVVYLVLRMAAETGRLALFLALYLYSGKMMLAFTGSSHV